MADVRSLDPRFAPSSRLSSVRFLTYTGDEVRNISCKKITNPNTFDSLLHPNIGGLYDPSMGPCDKNDLCGTCGLNYVHCPGHMGHIPLPLPVYHPIFFMTLYKLIRGSCWNCHRLLSSPLKTQVFIGQLELVENGLISDALSLESKIAVEDADRVDKLRSLDSVHESISSFVARCKSSAAQSGTNVRLKTKNIVDFKQMLTTNFLKACGITLKKCTYCEAPVRTARQENHTRIFLKALAPKKATSWVTARKTELRRKREILEARKEAGEGEKGERVFLFIIIIVYH